MIIIVLIFKGAWIVKYSIQSQTLLNVSYAIPVPAFIRYNYFMHNYYLNSIQDYVDSWPRSYAVGIFGAQKVDIHFNRFKNLLLDFELISGCKVFILILLVIYINSVGNIYYFSRLI